MIEPKVVIHIHGKKLYWCYAKDQQMLEELCKGKYFSMVGKQGKTCRLCLGLSEGKHWPEPWANIGKEEKTHESP